MTRATLLLFAVLAMAGCGNNPSDPDTSPGGSYTSPGGSYGVTTVDVHGRNVTCVTWNNGYGGGISCDWEHQS